MFRLRSRRFCDDARGRDGESVKQITCGLLHLRYCSRQPVVGCRGSQQWRRGGYCIGGSGSCCQGDFSIASCACRARI